MYDCRCEACNEIKQLQVCWACSGSGKSKCDGDVDDCEICGGKGGWTACLNVSCPTYDARLITGKLPATEIDE